MSVTQPEPIDARFVQMVCEYLERVHDRIRTQSEPDHMRFIAPRKTLISDAVVKTISAAASGWSESDAPPTAWQWASVVLWARELAELEVFGRPASHADSDYARSVRAASHVARPVPHRVLVVHRRRHASDTHP